MAPVLVEPIAFPEESKTSTSTNGGIPKVCDVVPEGEIVSLLLINWYPFNGLPTPGNPPGQTSRSPLSAWGARHCELSVCPTRI